MPSTAQHSTAQHSTAGGSGIFRYIPSVGPTPRVGPRRAGVLVGGIRRKVIRMSLNRQTTSSEDLWKAFSEITIGKIDKAQAARS